jgi:hypothetical protein
MSVQKYAEDESTYDDILEANPLGGVGLLSREGVEVDNQNGRIKVPERYLESGVDAVINKPVQTTLSVVSDSVRSNYRSSSGDLEGLKHRIYGFGRQADEGIEDNEDYDSIGFEVWDRDDSHGKARYGSICGLIGSSSFALGGKEESALALGLAGAGMEGLSRYFHGRRDETIEQALEGLSQAYGGYEIEVKEEKKR